MHFSLVIYTVLAADFFQYFQVCQCYHVVSTFRENLPILPAYAEEPFVEYIVDGKSDSVNFGEGYKIDPKKYPNFYLYTPEDRDQYTLIIGNTTNLEGSSFKKSRPTKILTHGYTNSYLTDNVVLIRDAYLNTTNCNVIAVDWRLLAAGPFYNKAAANTLPVGNIVAQMVDFLVASGVKVKSIHLIGHSLGAHVMGIAAKQTTSGLLHRVTGLDPALPLFNNKPADERIDASDATVVDCVHTCGLVLGFYNPLCTQDFYPNGGKPSQPGCLVRDLIQGGLCSHEYSYHLYSSSIYSKNKFHALACNTFDDVSSGNCSGTSVLMGEPAVNWPSGIYYLEATEFYPYCVNCTRTA